MAARVILCAALLVASVSAGVYFEDTFDTDPFQRWVTSKWKSEEKGKWEHTAGDWHVSATDNLGIRTSQDMAHHSISTKLSAPFSNADSDLVIQFTVKHERKGYSFCGGGYIKLIPDGLNQENFNGDDVYNIMFGPDLCGYDVSRIHVIFRDAKNKNLLKKDEVKLDHAEKDEYTHLYTLVVKKDGTYQVLFDNKEKAAGKLLEGWEFPAKTYDDPSDKKPADWVDAKEIDDPEDKKPEGYDVPEMIADPNAVKPAEWDDETDGEYEPPMVKNPAFKGDWKPKRIPNPAYKGEWKAKQIDNPDFSETVAVYDHSYLGFELWTVNNGSIFDNILITDDAEVAKNHAETHWAPFSGEKEKKAKEAYDAKKKEASTPPADTPATKPAEDAAPAAAEVDGDEDKPKGKDEL